MRVLLDECIPRQLRRDLTGHDVQTVQDLGWAGLKNGVLLSRASDAGIEAFITVDRNIEFQLVLRSLQLGVVAVRSRSNDIAAIRPLVARILAALSDLRAGQLIRVSE